MVENKMKLPEKILELVEPLILEGKREEIKLLFKEYKNDLNTFFERINKGNFLNNKKDADIILEKLKSHSRLMTITSDYDLQKTLIDKNFHSPQDIAKIGKKRFIIEVAQKGGIDIEEAKIIFAKAKKIVTRD